MKAVASLILLLGVTQCSSEPEKGAEKEAKESPSDVDAGARERDGGATASRAPDFAWLTPGPAPFNVPTRRLELPAYEASVVVPVGTTARVRGDAVEVKLGEGKNLWFVVTNEPVELEASGMVIERGDDFVVWERGGAWFFARRGELSCRSVEDASHDQGDVRMMLAACRSIEST